MRPYAPVCARGSSHHHETYCPDNIVTIVTEVVGGDTLGCVTGAARWRCPTWGGARLRSGAGVSPPVPTAYPLGVPRSDVLPRPGSSANVYVESDLPNPVPYMGAGSPVPTVPHVGHQCVTDE